MDNWNLFHSLNSFSSFWNDLCQDLVQTMELVEKYTFVKHVLFQCASG